jgi:hypothetical protein
MFANPLVFPSRIFIRRRRIGQVNEKDLGFRFSKEGYAGCVPMQEIAPTDRANFSLGEKSRQRDVPGAIMDCAAVVMRSTK